MPKKEELAVVSYIFYDCPEEMRLMCSACYPLNLTY